MPTIAKKKTKMIVKDGNGGLLQLLPETEVDVELDEESSNPVASSAVAEALSGIEDAASNMGAIKVMDEEPTALNTTEYTGETLIAWVQPKVGWSITVDTEVQEANGKKTGIPFNLYGQNGITMTVDWGDGTTSTLTSADYSDSLETTASMHEYAEPGIYTVIINSNDWENTYIFQAITSPFPTMISPDTFIETSYGYEYYSKTLISVNNALPKIKGTIFSQAVNSYIGNGSYYTYDPSKPSIVHDNLIGCFFNCTSLQFVSSDLFSNNIQASMFNGCFFNCTSLQFVSSDLFSNNIAAVDFRYCFFNCTSLTSIPSGLFDSNTATTSFQSCFWNCTSIQSIPAGLFDSNTIVTSFQSCFYNCSSLQSIPEGLFDSNTTVTTFSQCFRDCSSLQSIPSWLFDKNTVVTTFYCCFYDCTSLTDFTLHIGSLSVSNCSSFVTSKSGTTRTIYVPSGSTTQTTFQTAYGSSQNITIIGE